MNVPSYEEFEAIRLEMAELREQVRYALALLPDWLTIEQTCKALQCSRWTVHRLTKLGKLQPRYEGSRPLYEVSQLRVYIESTRVSAESATNRLLLAQQDKTRPNQAGLYH